MRSIANSMKAFRARVAGLSGDERGMEAAQVILILVLVIVGLMPILLTIKDKLAANANEVSAGIDAF